MDKACQSAEVGFQNSTSTASKPPTIPEILGEQPGTLWIHERRAPSRSYVVIGVLTDNALYGLRAASGLPAQKQRPVREARFLNMRSYDRIRWTDPTWMVEGPFAGQLNISIGSLYAFCMMCAREAIVERSRGALVGHKRSFAVGWRTSVDERRAAILQSDDR